MGANATKQMVDTINTTISQSLSTTTVDQSLIVNPNQIISQSIELIIGPGGSLSCGAGEFAADNSTEVTVTAQGQFKSDQYAELAATADAAYDQAIKDAVDQSNEDFNLGQFNFNSLVEKVVNESKAISESSITTSMQQTVAPTTNLTQAIKLTVFGNFQAEGCDFSNYAAVDISTDYAADNLTTSLLQSEAGQELQQELENSVVQSNKGLSLGGIIGVIVAVIVLILIIAIPLGVLHAQGKI